MDRFLIAAALATSFAVRPEPVDDPRFAVREASTLHKEFEHTLEVESTAIRIYVAGLEELVDGSATIGLTAEDAGRIEVTDEYLSMAAGRPGKLRRTFDRIESREDQRMRFAMGQGHADSHKDRLKVESSELEGRSVLFALDPGTGSYETAFAGEGGEESLLDGLNEDMDFRFLLPPAKVAVGDAWSIDPKLCGAIFAPGGDLKLVDEEADEDPGWGIGREIRRNLSGKARAVWKGVREEDGRRIGVVGLELDLKSAGESGAKDPKAGTIRFRLALELVGDLVWDLDAGHFRSFRAGGKVRYDMAARKTTDVDGVPTEMRHEIDLEGEAEYTASAR